MRNLELWTARTEQRLQQGAQTFGEIRSQQEKMAAESPTRVIGKIVWGFVGVIFLAGAAFGTLQSVKTSRADVKELIFENSPYRLDQQKIDRVVNRYDGDQSRITDKLTEIYAELRGISAKLSELTNPRARDKRPSRR